MEELLQIVKDTLYSVILYAEYSSERQKEIRNIVDKYVDLKDKNSADEEIRKLRKDISKIFYDTYELCFLKSLSDNDIPIKVKLFLYYGLLDERLVSSEHIISLFKIYSQKENAYPGIYTMYEWLLAIYNGEKETSLNEFSLDYPGMIRERKKNKEITSEEAQEMLLDQKARVSFEIQNMFITTSRMLSQRITTFCPLLRDDEMYKLPEDLYLKKESIRNEIDRIKGMDYSIFYRDLMYSAPEIGIEREDIKVEILPDVILMPCIGNKGVMWQEVEGANRRSPGRFILPMFCLEDITPIMTKLCAAFRWEICKREQGARWMDPGERSLTSDFYNFIIDYKKNHSLSAEIKEKIKNSLLKHRNSPKEIFCEEYCNYLTYETQGAVKLIRFIREIIFTYCPLSAKYRQEVLNNNPQYQKMLEQKNAKDEHAIHLHDIVIKRIENMGEEIPEELVNYMNYLQM